MSFGEETNLTVKRSKYGIYTVGSIHITVTDYLVSGETCVKLDRHTYTIVLGKECVEIYNWNRPVKLQGLIQRVERSFEKQYHGRLSMDTLKLSKFIL